MADLGQLSELRNDSGQRLPNSIVVGFTNSCQSVLQVQLTVSDGRQAAKITDSIFSGRLRGDQKLLALRPEPNDNMAVQLNKALLGSTGYPTLNAVLGTVAGLGTGGAGLLFTVATTALSESQTSPHVLARDGDEIWRVEEIGKVTKAGRAQPTYVLSYFLIDPYRRNSQSHKGWLLHEARFDLLT
jgi:hypothetical protein